MISPSLSKWVKRFNVTVAILALGYVVFSFGYVAGKMRASGGARAVTRGVDASTGKPFEYIENAKLSDLEIDAIVNAKETPEHPLSVKTKILQEHFKKEREEQAKAEASGVKSVLCTNYVDWNYLGKPENLEATTKIYDVGFIVYSQEFAKRFGYPKSHVYPLDKGMHVMEFRLTTEGVSQRCYLNILMEKGLGLDVPEISYVMRSLRNGVRFRFPKEVEGFQLRPEDKDYRKKFVYEKPNGDHWENYYSRNIRLATLDYVPRQKGSSCSEMLVDFSSTYYQDYDYFSIDVGFETKILENGAAIWIKKKGGADYTMKGQADPDEFLKFKLPRPLIEKILPLMIETDSYSFLANMKGVNKNETLQTRR